MVIQEFVFQCRSSRSYWIKIRVGQVDFSLQDNVNNYLWELVVNVKQIESIYLYSNNGLVASADRQELHYPRYRCIKDYEWYDEEEYGEYHVDFSSDDFYRKGDMPEISFRRAVRSTTKFKKSVI